MNMRASSVAALVAALLSAPGFCAQASALEVGQPLPPITGATWLVGDAPSAGTVMLVDLWAPEDPAARATMPCLTDLQHRHVGRVQVVGLTAAPPEIADAFITRMGARIDYRLAAVPSVTAWMPSGVGPPVTLMVDSRGTVVWWGDATQAARPLAQLLDGTFVPAPGVLPTVKYVGSSVGTGVEK